jgi:hypothetical protein
MKPKNKISLIIVVVILASFSVRKYNPNSQKPANGYVPNEETAIKIAEAVIIPIYGEKVVKNEKPFIAELKDSTIWVIHGTLRKGRIGGVTYVEINKSDGRILNIYATK